MPRIPSRVQVAALGERNPANPGRAIAPSLKLQGPAFPFEQFSDVADPSIRRALLQLQQNARQAFAQTKGSPFARSNILHGVTLKQGAANGAAPLNMLAHSLGVAPSGYAILFTQGGYVTAHALIAPAPMDSLIQVWTQFTAFAGVTAVTADVLVYA